MDTLRRLRRTQGSGPTKRTRPRLDVGHLMPLRGAERRLATALDQLRAGVPLNWSQVEDDPELATLSYLEDVAGECRERALVEMPLTLREGIYNDLLKRLPPPKKVVVKEAPKSLAGFSENVPVLTQTEEHIPQLTSRAPQVAGALVLAVGLIAVIFWGVNNIKFESTPDIPAYNWIKVTQGDTVLTNTAPPPQNTIPLCRDYSFTDPEAKRRFISIPDVQQMQSNVGFPIVFLPKILEVPNPPTYTTQYALGLSNISVASCEEEFSVNDRGTVVKVEYTTSRDDDRGVANTSSIVLFQARRRPTTFDVGTGKWKEVKIGGSHGVYWRGGPYRDLAGTQWIGDVSVMIVERGDSVLTFVGQVRPGVNEQFLTEAVSILERERATEENLKSASLMWIDVVRGDQTLLAKTLPADYKEPDCFGLNTPSFYVSVRNRDLAQDRVGYPILTLPESIPGPSVTALMESDELPPDAPITSTYFVTATLGTTYTLRLADVGILTCNREAADLNTKVKLRYVVRVIQERPNQPGLNFAGSILEGAESLNVSDIIMFQQKRYPTALHVEGGNWEQIEVAGAKGVFWSGSQYHDPEGLFWQDGANVLILEKGDMVVTLESTRSQKELLVTLAEQIDWVGGQ